VAAVLGQPVGEHAAGRSGADNDEIVLRHHAIAATTLGLAGRAACEPHCSAAVSDIVLRERSLQMRSAPPLKQLPAERTDGQEPSVRSISQPPLSRQD